MTLGREQNQSLTRTIHLLRPAWPEHRIHAALAKVADRDPFEIALAAFRAAKDTKVQWPEVIPSTGSHWNEEAPKPRPTGRIEPKRDEACATCGRREDTHGSPWLKDHLFLPIARASEGRASAPPDLRTHIHPTITYAPQENA